MSIEGFSKRGMELGNDPEGIRETKNATDNLHTEYLNFVKSLALEKMKNSIIFEGKLKATMRRLTSLGFNVTRENILKDIQTEINKQMLDFDIDFDREMPGLGAELQSEIQQPTQINNEIGQLKMNLGGIFADTPTQQQVSQQETEQVLQEQQKQMKDKIISQIIVGMNNSGELLFGDISISERMSIMQNIQDKLHAKSMEELQILLSSYQKQDIQEETMSSRMHR